MRLSPSSCWRATVGQMQRIGLASGDPVEGGDLGEELGGVIGEEQAEALIESACPVGGSRESTDCSLELGQPRLGTRRLRVGLVETTLRGLRLDLGSEPLLGGLLGLFLERFDLALDLLDGGCRLGSAHRRHQYEHSD